MQKHQTEHIRAVLQALDENMSYREIEAWLHISKTAALHQDGGSQFRFVYSRTLRAG